MTSAARQRLVSRPSAASALARAEREPGPRGDTTRRFNIHRFCREAPGSRVSLRSPGTREGRAKSRRAKRTVGRRPNSRCQTAQCCSFPRRVAASGFCLLLVAPASPSFAGHRLRQTSARKRAGRFQPPRRRIPHPDEGWMERRQAHSFFRSRLRTRDHPVAGADRDLLSALHRGGFRMRTHEAGSRQWNRSRSELPAPSIRAWRSGSRTSRVAVRAAAVGRHSPLRLSGSFLENAPLSQDANPVPQTRYVVNI